MRRKYIALFELYAEYINQFPLSVPQFPQFLEAPFATQARKRHEMKKKEKKSKLGEEKITHLYLTVEVFY